MTSDIIRQVLNNTIDINHYLYGLIDKEKTVEVEEILLSDELSPFIDMGFKNDAFLRLACSKNNVALVSLFLTHPNITPAQIKNEYADNNFNALVTACYAGNLEVVKYLLTSPKLKGKFNINAQKSIAIKFAINENHEELTHYLFSDEVSNSLDLSNNIFDFFQLLNYNIRYHHFGFNAMFRLIELSEQHQIDLTKYEDTHYGTTLLDVVAQCDNVELTQKIYHYFSHHSYLIEQAIRYCLSEKAFQSAYYLLVEDKRNFYYDKSQYSDKEIVHFLEKYELFQKYNKERDLDKDYFDRHKI